MSDTSAVAQFKELFGDIGGLRIPGNVGNCRNAAAICRSLFDVTRAELFDYFCDWHQLDDPNIRAKSDPPGLMDVSLALLRNGQWEASWCLLQLYFDQVQKHEREKSLRQNKGDSLCGLALAGQWLGSPAIERHYALLSSAGDVYYEDKDTALRHGGLAPTLLEKYESFDEHSKWRLQVRAQLEPLADETSLYLEPFVAARWFGKSFAEKILKFAIASDANCRPFTEVLLDVVEQKAEANAKDDIGTLFEATVGLLLARTPGFEVRESRQTTDEQTDLVVNYSPDRLARALLASGPGLVECKATKTPVGAPQLREFGAKCSFHRVKFGILATMSGISGTRRSMDSNAELVRRRLLVDGITIIVLRLQDFRGVSRNLRCLQDAIAKDHDELVFGPISGSA
jgi:hypothetical protein